MQTVRHLTANETARRVQTCQGRLRVILGTSHRHHDPGGAAIIGKVYFGDVGQADPWIGQFTFHDGLDFFAQSTRQAFPVVLHAATFDHTIPQVKNVREYQKTEFPAGKNISEEFQEAVRHFSPTIVGNSVGLTLHFFHQAIQVVAGT